MANKTKDLRKLIQEQYIKCATDPVWFMKQFCYIQHPKKGKIKFNLFDFQEEALSEFKDNLYNIILKARQLGISTLVAGYALWSMLFNDDFNVLVIATNQEVAKNLVTKVQVMHDHLPSWLKGNVITNNKLSIKFANGSQIKAISSSSTGARSEALSLLIVDEAAFIRNIDDIWIASQATLSTGGGAIILSTPNGVGNFFHKKWQQAIGMVDEKESDDIDWNDIRIRWDRHPDRDAEWARKQLSLLGERGFAQEHDCDFIASGHTVVDGPCIQEYDKKTVDPIETRYGGAMWIWKYVDYSKDYMVIADVARGDGSDYSAFHIFDVESVEQVAEYHGKIPPAEFGRLLVAVATEWNNAVLAIENANIGYAAIQPAIDAHYPNLFYTYKQDGYVDTEVQIKKGYDIKDKSQMVPGVSTTTRTRPLMISALERYMRERTPILNSRRLIQELLVFVWDNGKAQAQVGYNDDLVMAFAIGLWIRDTALKLRQQGIDMNRNALSHMQKSSQIMLGNQNQQNSGWEWETGFGNENLTWLL